MSNTEEIELVRAALPTEPKKDTIRICEKRRLLKGDYLIFSCDYIYETPIDPVKRKVVKVRCTSCGEAYHLPYAKYSGCQHFYNTSQIGFYLPESAEVTYSGDACMCPVCGATGEALHVSAFGNKQTTIIDHCDAYEIHNIRGHLAILNFHIYKNADKSGNVYYEPHLYMAAVMIDGKFALFKGFHTFSDSYIWYDEWESRKKFNDYLSLAQVEEIMPFDAELVDGTDCEKSGLCDYLKLPQTQDSMIVAYLRQWVKHPNIENLIRTGYQQQINDLLKMTYKNTPIGYRHTDYVTYDSSSPINLLNFKKKKPNEILGLSKEEYKAFQKKDIVDILMYAQVTKKGYKIDISELDILSDKLKFIELISKPVNGYNISPVRLINYLTKGKDGYAIGRAQYLHDYWNMFYDVYGEMTESELFPRNLKTAHDRVMALQKEKDNKEASKKIKAQAKKKKFLEWQDKKTGLLIKLPESYKDLFYEGKVLQHCVATYASSVAKGDTTILFIRKIEEPDKPYFTLEYKNGRVMQNRGFKNCAENNNVIKFKNKWLKHIEGENINGKQRVSAGA